MLWSTLCQLFILFFLTSCLGWCIEVTLKLIQYHRFINRGFLIGPYCPIYGCGVVAVTVLVGGLIGRRGTVGEIFLAGMVLCGALEYFTSWYMEKLFHARWWDYSTKPMNLHGRIWIGNLILFGLACVVIVRWLDPLFFTWMERWSDALVYCFAGGAAALLAADEVTSHLLMRLVRQTIDAQDGDNTEAITTQIRALLRDKTLLLRRIQAAYPNMQARPRRLMDELHRVQGELRKAQRRTKQLLREAVQERKAHARIPAQLEAELRRMQARQQEMRQKLREVQRRITPHRDE